MEHRADIAIVGAGFGGSLMAMVASGFAMCLLAFLLEVKRQAEEDPEQSEKVAVLKESLWRF